VILVETQDQ